MNIFVAIIFKKSDRGNFDELVYIDNYLPSAPSRSQRYISPNGNVHLYSYVIGPASPDCINVSEDGFACILDGILLPATSLLPGDALKKWPLDHLRNLDGHFGFEGEGEFSLTWTDGNRLFCRTNIGGSHNLYITQTTDFVAISNRSACLLGLPGVSHALDPVTVQWKAFQGYACWDSTTFTAIKKVGGGKALTIDQSGEVSIDFQNHLEIKNPDIQDEFLSFPLKSVNNEVDRISNYMLRAHKALGSPEIEVSLSGGKDSRVILALLVHAGMIDSVSKIWTRGPLYSPEVLAAQDLCREIGFKDHEVRRPPLIASGTVSARTIINTINLQDGMLSLFDFCGIQKRNSFHFQGHELGLRAGRFARFNTMSIELFNETVQKSWSNPLGVVYNENDLRSSIASFFSLHHRAGAPVEDLGDLYSIFERLPSWAAVMSLPDYCGGAISNPLLEGGVIRFALSVPADFRRAEAFGYLLINRTVPKFLNVPFAEQVWPASLENILNRLGLNNFKKSPLPYVSSSHFPNLKNPYIPNIKIEYFNVLKPVVSHIFLKHRTYFDQLFDVDAFLSRLRNTLAPSMTYLYSALGLYSAAFLQEYGTAIFDRTRQAAVVKDLEERIFHSFPDLKQQTSSSSHAIDSPVAEIVERHEKAIAGFVRDLRDAKEALSVSS